MPKELLIVITKDMRIGTILADYPETNDIFVEYEMDCFHCLKSKFETLEQAAQVHGYDVNELLYVLNEAVTENQK